MLSESDLKHQRDRFLAFAFAAADMLVEMNGDGRITFASGAVRAMTGFEEGELLRQSFCDLFVPQDHDICEIIRLNTKIGSKQGPYLETIKHKNSALNSTIKGRAVFISSFMLNAGGPYYIALSYADALISFIEFNRLEKSSSEPASLKDFDQILRRKIADIIDGERDAKVELIQLDGMNKAQKKLDQKSWNALTASIGELMMESSLDGESAVKVEDGKFLLLRENEDGEDNSLREKMTSLLTQYDLSGAVGMKSKNIEGDLSSLTAREATRAIFYTIEKMQKKGLDAVSGDLKTAFASFLEENATKITNLKRLISHQDFRLFFQPIVDLASGKISHHEVLVRFNGDESPFELITMSEDIGLSLDMDLAICRQCIKYTDRNRHKKIGKFAVNLSGQSIENERFVKKLLNTLDEYPKAAAHLMFEITESSEIKDLKKVDAHIQMLRSKSYAVCLDDFGAGSASFQYLHGLNVDGVKIDGSYIRQVTQNIRDATMVKSMTQLCHEMGIYVVAEMIETSEQRDFLNSIGVDKGQGWLFGKAAAQAILLE